MDYINNYKSLRSNPASESPNAQDFHFEGLSHDSIAALCICPTIQPIIASSIPRPHQIMVLNGLPDVRSIIPKSTSSVQESSLSHITPNSRLLLRVEE